MSTFYYSTNVYKFSSNIYFSSVVYWVRHVDDYFLLFFECVVVVGRVCTIGPQVGSHKISISTQWTLIKTTFYSEKRTAINKRVDNIIHSITQ